MMGAGERIAPAHSPHFSLGRKRHTAHRFTHHHPPFSPSFSLRTHSVHNAGNIVHCRDQMVAVAWRALRLSEQSMKLLWEIFEEEFMERIDTDGSEDEQELPF